MKDIIRGREKIVRATLGWIVEGITKRVKIRGIIRGKRNTGSAGGDGMRDIIGGREEIVRD